MTGPAHDTDRMTATHESSKLLSLAVHEFRTPMTIVAGYLRMLIRDRAGPLTPEQRKLVEEAERACGRLTGLMTEMSDLANLDGGVATFNRARVPLFPLLDEVAQVEPVSGRNVAVEVRGERTAVAIEGDGVRLRAALTAVLTVVIREAIKSDLIVIDVKEAPKEPGGRQVVLALGDERCIDEMESAIGHLNVFDEWRGGTGLGLAVARRVIEAHHGRIWSPPGSDRRAGALLSLPLLEQ